jgi:hypothetical protein
MTEDMPQPLLANLPPAVAAAIAAHDAAAFQCALDELPADQRDQLIAALSAAGIIGSGPASEAEFQAVLTEFELLIQAIVTVAQGRADAAFLQEQRQQVRQALPKVEAAGYHLQAAVEMLWAGERQPAKLVKGLDPLSARLALHLLERIEGRVGQAAALDPDAIVAGLPGDVLQAIDNQDEAAYQSALDALAPAERDFVAGQLARLQEYEDRQATEHSSSAESLIDAQAPVEPLDELSPLIQAIVTVARQSNAPTGDPRPQLDDFLENLQEQGLELAGPVRRIWAGERDAAALTDGLAEPERQVIREILRQLEP